MGTAQSATRNLRDPIPVSSEPGTRAGAQRSHLGVPGCLGTIAKRIFLQSCMRWELFGNSFGQSLFYIVEQLRQQPPPLA